MVERDLKPHRRRRWAGTVLRNLPFLAAAALIAIDISPFPFGKRAVSQGSLSEASGKSPAQFEATEPGRGRLAGAPGQIPLKGWADILWRTFNEAGADRLPAVASGVAFSALMAIFPALGVFVSLYGLFADVSTAEKQLLQLSSIFPPQIVRILGDQMLLLAASHPAKLSIAFALSLLLSIWSANAGIGGLFDGLNVAYGEREKRGWVGRTLISLAFTAALAIFVVLLTAILVAAPIALQAAGLKGVDYILAPLSWLLAFLLSSAALAAAYRYGPSREPARWRWVNWGAPLAGALWLAGSLGFSWYIQNLAHYDRTYGPLGAVIAFMVWLWFSVLIILLGAELNAEMEHQTALDTTTGLALPLGRRGAVMADSVGRMMPGRRKARRGGP